MHEEGLQSDTIEGTGKRRVKGTINRGKTSISGSIRFNLRKTLPIASCLRI